MSLLWLIPRSYTYDLTSTLQDNLTRPPTDSNKLFNDRFAWNYHMMAAPFADKEAPKRPFRWLLPLVHGHVDQASAFNLAHLSVVAEVPL